MRRKHEKFLKIVTDGPLFFGIGEEALSRMLESLNPASVLDRGYAAVYLNKRAVSDAQSASPGAKIDIRMRDGSLAAQVTGVELNKENGCSDGQADAAQSGRE